MTRTIIATIVTAAMAMSLSAQQIFIPGYDKEPDDEPVELFPPYEAVHTGRELPRSFTVAYPDEQSARRGSLGPSLYIQPMNDPQTTRAEGYNEFTWNFKIPFAWVGRQAFVYVGGADSPYTVIVNGEEIGSNQSCRSAAEFDVTGPSKEGVNTLTIRVNTADPAGQLSVYPTRGRITGKVLVHSQPRIRVRDYVMEANLASEEATVQLGVILKTHLLNAHRVRIHYALRDMDGVTVSSGYRDAEVGLKEEDTVRFLMAVKDLRPWTYETPNLYDLTIRTQYEGRFTEYINYRTGFSNIYMEEGRLLSDGYPLPLSAYQMRAVPEPSELLSTLAQIRAGGHNLVIPPGYPVGDEFHRACDSLGLMVCAQTDINTSGRGLSQTEGENPSNDPRWAESFTDRALTMYYTSANHPSTAMFSIGRNSSNGYNLYESYLALKARGDRRPVIYPETDGQWNTDAVTSIIAAERPSIVGERIVLQVPISADAYPAEKYTQTTVDPDGNLTVSNNSLLTPLRGQVSYTVKLRMKKIAQGTLPVVVEPGGKTTVAIPVPESHAGKKLSYEISLVSNFDRFE